MIAVGTGKVIAVGTGKVIAVGTGKVIAPEGGTARGGNLRGIVRGTWFPWATMANRRMEMHRLQELVRLHRIGTGAREVARLLKMSPNTERAYRKALEAAELLHGAATSLPELDKLKEALLASRPPPGPRSQEVSSIEPWADEVAKLFSKGLTAKPIYDRSKLENKTFEGSYPAVKRMCHRLREQRGVQAQDVAIPVETKPGEVAQVDFGYVGKLLCPQNRTLRRAWVFVVVLSYSRHM